MLLQSCRRFVITTLYLLHFFTKTVHFLRTDYFDVIDVVKASHLTISSCYALIHWFNMFNCNSTELCSFDCLKSLLQVWGIPCWASTCWSPSITTSFSPLASSTLPPPSQSIFPGRAAVTGGIGIVQKIYMVEDTFVLDHLSSYVV